MKYYIYVHVGFWVDKNGDNKFHVFYIGKGTGYRFKSTKDRSIAYNKLVKRFEGVSKHKIFQTDNEEEALLFEYYLIKFFRKHHQITNKITHTKHHIKDITDDTLFLILPLSIKKYLCWIFGYVGYFDFKRKKEIYNKLRKNIEIATDPLKIEEVKPVVIAQPSDTPISIFKLGMQGLITIDECSIIQDDLNASTVEQAVLLGYINKKLVEAKNEDYNGVSITTLNNIMKTIK